MFKRTVFAACLMAGVAISVSAPARADDIATRIFNIENQIRQLTGQIEELNHSMQQLQQQIAAGGQQQGALEQAPAQIAKPKPNLKKLAATSLQQDGQPVEAAIGEQSSGGTETIIDGTDQASAGQVIVPKKAATISGILNDDGTQVDGTQVAVSDGTQPAVSTADGIEQVSLTPATETPEALYEKNYEALLRRQFGDAETGFRNFLTKYPQHSLSGSAQFQLGETFYAQGKYEDAARNYLQGYKTYPKSRRAPDSLMKLGLSLNKLGQKEQACAALASVGTEYPKAVEVKKRADAEYKRGGC